MTNRKQVQINFEASCFMHEVSESNLLNETVRKYKDGEEISKKQRHDIAKNIIAKKISLWVI